MIYSTPRIILFYNIFNKFSHYASNEIILLFCPEKKLNHSGNSYIALPETIIFHKKYLYCSIKTVISPLRATILHIYLAFFIRIEGWCLPFIVFVKHLLSNNNFSSFHSKSMTFLDIVP